MNQVFAPKFGFPANKMLCILTTSEKYLFILHVWSGNLIIMLLIFIISTILQFMIIIVVLKFFRGTLISIHQ